MPTPARLWLLLNAVVWPAFAQSAAPTDPMRIEAAVQHERDNTRLFILQEEQARESRALALTETSLRNAVATRSTPNQVKDITARITLHRHNLTALAREIALTQAKRPVAALASSSHPPQVAASIAPASRTRQPDDWLIVRQWSTPPVQNTVPPLVLRRRLASTPHEAGLPQWIIQSGLTGVLP